jgi:hypothetical protein
MKVGWSASYLVASKEGWTVASKVADSVALMAGTTVVQMERQTVEKTALHWVDWKASSMVHQLADS